MDLGATGDGRSDDSQAFMKTWEAACKSYSEAASVIIIPERTFMLKPSTFDGPCNPSHIYIQIFGNIVAPNNKSAWIGYHINTWLSFTKVNGLIISGQGQIDGQGSAWWPQPCLQHVPNGAKCNGPTALMFNRCNGLQLNGLTHINSPRNHITVANCKGVVVSNLQIIAPQTSPNTDGIRISSSNNVRIKNCTIGTGDDCIAISGGSSNIDITSVTCGPGHGISIGALGRGGYETVEDIHVRNCTLKETLNGVRIKTWQGGNGYARTISFEKIKFIEVKNPIIIDQFYCPGPMTCQNKTIAVQVSDISYSKIFGTSASDAVINLSCNQVNGCGNISFDYVYISSTIQGRTPYANCFNAYGRFSHAKPAPKCLMTREL